MVRFPSFSSVKAFARLPVEVPFPTTRTGSVSTQVVVVPATTLKRPRTTEPRAWAVVVIPKEAE